MFEKLANIQRQKTNQADIPIYESEDEDEEEDDEENAEAENQDFMAEAG